MTRAEEVAEIVDRVSSRGWFKTRQVLELSLFVKEKMWFAAARVTGLLFRSPLLGGSWAVLFSVPSSLPPGRSASLPTASGHRSDITLSFPNALLLRFCRWLPPLPIISFSTKMVSTGHFCFRPFLLTLTLG